MNLWEVKKYKGGVIRVVADSIRSLFIHLKNEGLEDQVNDMHIIHKDVEVAESYPLMYIDHVGKRCGIPDMSDNKIDAWVHNIRNKYNLKGAEMKKENITGDPVIRDEGEEDPLRNFVVVNESNIVIRTYEKSKMTENINYYVNHPSNVLGCHDYSPQEFIKKLVSDPEGVRLLGCAVALDRNDLMELDYLAIEDTDYVLLTSDEICKHIPAHKIRYNTIPRQNSIKTDNICIILDLINKNGLKDVYDVVVVDRDTGGNITGAYLDRDITVSYKPCSGIKAEPKPTKKEIFSGAIDLLENAIKDFSDSNPPNLADYVSEDHADIDIIVLYDNYEELKEMDVLSYEEVCDACCERMTMSVIEFFREIDNDGQILGTFPFVYAINRKLKTVVTSLIDKNYYISLPYGEYKDLCELFKVINVGSGIPKSMYATVEPYIKEEELTKKGAEVEIKKKEPIKSETRILIFNTIYGKLCSNLNFDDLLTYSDISYTVSEFLYKLDNDSLFLQHVTFVCAVDYISRKVLDKLEIGRLELFVSDKGHLATSNLCWLFKYINDGNISFHSVVTVEDHMPMPSKKNVARDDEPSIEKAKPVLHSLVEITVMYNGYQHLGKGFSFEEYSRACDEASGDYISYSVNNFFREIDEDKEFLYQIPFICAVDIKNKRVLTFLKDDDRYITIFTADRIEYFNELKEDNPSLNNLDYVTFENLCELFNHINANKMTSVDIAVVAKVKRIEKNIMVRQNKEVNKVDVTITINPNEDEAKKAEEQFGEEGKESSDIINGGEYRDDIKVFVKKNNEWVESTINPNYDRDQLDETPKVIDNEDVNGAYRPDDITIIHFPDQWVRYKCALNYYSLTTNSSGTRITLYEFIQKLIEEPEYIDKIGFVAAVNTSKNEIVKELVINNVSFCMIPERYKSEPVWANHDFGVNLPYSVMKLMENAESGDLIDVIHAINKKQDNKWSVMMLAYDTLKDTNLTLYYIDKANV